MNETEDLQVMIASKYTGTGIPVPVQYRHDSVHVHHRFSYRYTVHVYIGAGTGHKRTLAKPWRNAESTNLCTPRTKRRNRFVTGTRAGDAKLGQTCIDGHNHCQALLG